MRDRSRTRYDGFGRARESFDACGNRTLTRFDSAANAGRIETFGPPGPSPIDDSGLGNIP